jgi:hypothetical protein
MDKAFHNARNWIKEETVNWQENGSFISQKKIQKHLIINALQVSVT